MAGGGATQQATQNPVAGNVFQTSSNLFNQAAGGPNIGQFMNPFTQDVVNRTGMDMARQASMQQNQLGAQASAAGAFGGSRHGVAEGTMLGDYGRAFGDIAAQQRQQGFNTALGAAQNQQGIQSGLAGQGFGFGQQINQNQLQQGTMQQAMIQDLINAARGQFGGFTNAPQNALNLPLQAVGAANMGQGTTTGSMTGTTNTTGSATTSQRPGLFNIISAGLGLL
jgi:hypothetical protein